MLNILTVDAAAQPLSLYDAIQYALQNNQTILYQAKQEKLSSFEQWNSVNALYNPTIKVQASLYRSFYKTEFQSQSSQENYSQVSNFQQIYPDITAEQVFLAPFGSKIILNGGIQTTISQIPSLDFKEQPTIGIKYIQPLTSDGILSGHSEKRQADISLQVSENNFQMQREQLVLSVITSYFQLWQATRTVEQSKTDVESARRILDIAEIKLHHGSIAEFEVLNLRVQYKLAEDNLLVFQNSLKTQAISFMRILGASTDSSFILNSSINIDTIDFSIGEAKQIAIKNRLEIKQSEISLERALLNHSLLASGNSPIIQVNAQYSRSSKLENSFLKSLEMPNYELTFSGTISFPLTDGGRTAANIEISKLNIAVIEKNIELLKQDIEIDIENRFRTLKFQRQRIFSLELSLNTAYEALKIAELRFNSGQISSTEIENVRNRYLAARNALDGAKISYIVERAGLAKEMGHLFLWIESIKGKQ